MRVLVTGGAGFIGSHLVENLRTRGDDVEVFDLRTGQDCLDFELVKKSVKEKDLVFHLANVPAHRLSVNDPYEIIKNNYMGTLNVVEACRLSDKKLVFTSSFGVYGSQEPPFREDMPMNPRTPYGIAKKACEEMLETYHRLYGMDILIVRPSNVWGKRDYLHKPLQVLPIWLERVKKGEEVVVYGENTSRDFTHINDEVAGIILAGRLRGFDVFNIASGKEIRLLDIARKLTDRVIVKPLPAYEAERWIGDITKAREKLGYQPKVDFWEMFESYRKERLEGTG